LTLAFTQNIQLERTVDIKAPADQVYNLVANVPKLGKLLPKLDRVVDEGDDVYRWEAEKVGIQSYNIQTVYGARYRYDPAARRVEWDPVPEIGNSRMGGFWQVDELGEGMSRLTFSTEAALHVPVPSLVKLAVGPLVKHEFVSAVERFLENIRSHLES